MNKSVHIIGRSLRTLPLLLLLTPILNACSATLKWPSQVTGNQIGVTISEPKTPAKDYYKGVVTVVYLENLGFEKVGGNSKKADVKWLLDQGYRVVELDYRNHPNAISPNINQDIIAINDSISSGSFCGLTDCSRLQSYVLFEGYRIARNVPYFKDDPAVYNRPKEYVDGDSLRMDIIYPANAQAKIPVILSFSYSNSYATYDSDLKKITAQNQNLRTKLDYTFAMFNDSFLEGASARGLAWAIADHPKYCPWGSGKPTDGPNDTYKSYQVNPDAAQKVKSAVRTLRYMSSELGLSGEIGIYGFSRGSDAGSMAVGDRGVPEFEEAGFNQGISDEVQAAALGPGVFDFTIIYDHKDDGDKNLEGRCPWAWGPLEENKSLWETMGSSYLVETKASAPVLFFYNTTDAPYYHDQINHLKAKLDSLGVPTSTLVDYGKGHSVPQDSESLERLYQFFEDYLKE